GMGCPIRSEIWGYVFPGAPDLAAHYARIDGTLDHTDESVCSEQMFAAMAADAFFESNLRRLAEKHMHYLKPGLRIRKLVQAAFDSYDQGLSLREARERILLLGGTPEPCDALPNVPFTFLALLYGENDLEKTILTALKCGYDTDCTLATAGAFIGQVLGAKGLPKKLRDIIGDELVMGIEYRRKEMTLTALARDTALMGLKIAEATGIVEFTAAPEFKPLPKRQRAERLRIEAEYQGDPSVAPGKTLTVDLLVKQPGKLDGDAEIVIETPKEWQASPSRIPVRFYQGTEPTVRVTLTARPDPKRWAQGHHFSAKLVQKDKTLLEEPFGAAGSMLWRLLGVHYDPLIPEGPNGEVTRDQIRERRGLIWRGYHVSFEQDYVDEKALAAKKEAADPHFENVSRLLGRPAVVACPTIFIRPQDLFGLQGEYVCYLDTEFYSPIERDAWFFCGANDGYRLYLNGKKVVEEDKMAWWTPRYERHTGRIRKGRNRLFLKLYKRGDDLRFSFGIRLPLGPAPVQFGGQPRNDWATDLEWANPMA
ncbi:ADP-ribosylglycohydrolase family protein, partial [bacterium]|nr:ADP-ribosylglycohydrolase family protein [bacterium]